MPPEDAPPDGESDTDDMDDGIDGSKQPVEPSNKAIQVFKHHCKVSVGSEYRKFQHKSWGGSQQLALAVSEVFMKQSNSMLWVFDGFKRKPVDRQNMLNSAGVDPKFMKSSIPSQRDALIRKLCKGLVENVESKLVDCIFNELTKGTDNSAWVLTSTCTGEDKFKAVFKGKTHNVEKICPGILNAIDWLKSMSIAEKARGVKQTQFGTVQFCTTLCSIQWFC